MRVPSFIRTSNHTYHWRSWTLMATRLPVTPVGPLTGNYPYESETRCAMPRGMRQKRQKQFVGEESAYRLRLRLGLIAHPRSPHEEKAHYRETKSSIHCPGVGTRMRFSNDHSRWCSPTSGKAAYFSGLPDGPGRGLCRWK